MKSHNDQHRQAKEIVEGLLRHEPINDADLRLRIKGVDKEILAKALADRMLQTDIQTAECEVLTMAFMQVGLGKEVERIVAAVTRSDLPGCVRAGSQVLVYNFAPDQIGSTEQRMTPEMLKDIIETNLQEIILGIEEHLVTGKELVKILETTQPETLRPAWEHIDQIRIRAGARAAVIYQQALRCDSMKPIHPAMLEKVCSEGGADAIALLTDLKKHAKNAEEERSLQGMLLRVQTAGIAPKKPSLMQVKGEAYVSTCDGQGAFVLFGRFHRRGSTSTTTANICIRAAGEVRDGFVIKRHPDRDFRDIMEQVKPDGSLEFVRISLSEGAAIVEEAMARTRSMGCTLPPEVMTAVRHFEETRDPNTSMEPMEALPHGTASLDLYREILAEDVYDYWFLDEGDLRAARIGNPPRSKVKASWFVDSAKKLAQTPYRDRVYAMARHMNLWHNWKKDPETAGWFAVAMAQMDRDFGSCSLVHAILEKSMLNRDPMISRTTECLELGDERQRQVIKELFFHGVTAPTGWDLALLDLTEAVVEVLDRIVFALPGERRPPNDSFLSIGHAIARAVLHEPRERARDMKTVITEAIMATTNLSEPEAALLAPTIGQSMLRFIEDCCGTCKASCLKRLDAKQAKAFFSPSHPARDACVNVDLEDLFAQDDPPESRKRGKRRIRDQGELRP